jgi:hypothetical protein
MSKKRTTLAIVAAVAAFGAVSASAAGLGGLTGKSLGAETTVVAGCDTDGIAVGYTTSYSAAAKEYQVTAVQLTGVATPACNGQSVALTLSDSTGAVLGTGSGTVSGASQTFTLSTAASAKSVANLAVVIAS